MKTIFGPALLLGAIAIMPVSANAAPSVLANTQFTLGSTCSFNSSASGSVAASCGSYSSGDGIDARASFGSIGIRTKAAGPSSVIGTGTPEENDFWRGAAAMNDTLSFSVDSGTFRLFTDIAISLIEEVSGSFGGSSLPFGRNIFSVRIGDETIFQRRHEYTNSLTTGVASLTSTDDFGSAGRGFVDLAFTGGSLDLHASIFSESRCGAMHTGNFFNKTGSCLLGVDAFNSLRLIGSSVFDADGKEVSGGFTSSESGFDYSVGVPPHGPVPIPLPATLPLLAGGLAIFFFGRRKTTQAG
ncbi:hypothetical protein [Roseibium album]|uniref:hypothetical protein n=1 Tax=Roseibium album TaxID=311410 RepID=UPI002A5C8909|nr:hypothetical protein [Paracoccaceae bacterium]